MATTQQVNQNQLNPYGLGFGWRFLKWKMLDTIEKYLNPNPTNQCSPLCMYVEFGYKTLGIIAHNPPVVWVKITLPTRGLKSVT